MLGRDTIPKSSPIKIEPVYDTGSPVKENLIIASDAVTTTEEIKTFTESNSAFNDVIVTAPAKEELKDTGTINIGDKSGGLDISTATDCMICGNAFMQDWQHKEYNTCPKCREKIKNLIGV
jgi:hypothetical protein